MKSNNQQFENILKAVTDVSFVLLNSMNTLAQQMETLAKQEAPIDNPRHYDAKEFIESIVILREEKHFSFRKIAAWFNENGVPITSNQIYRTYKIYERAKI